MQTTLKLFYAASNNNLLKTMVAQPTNVAPIQLNSSPRDCYFAIRHCSSRSLWSSWTHTEGTSKTFHSSLLLLLIVVKCRNKVLVLGFEAIESSCRLTPTPILGYESPSMKPT